ncbi:Protein of unknown function [Pyronema omphalodes CBS 100304]|uniref:Uncharacterized protein n=1 Tax=Pyronema omphalodes (strain CBS 100304) TaxID=1076935 RepID=U4LBL9_PYROM|nr:Protein of unknown function [Pyronema omphalodes CBS 100304]
MRGKDRYGEIRSTIINNPVHYAGHSELDKYRNSSNAIIFWLSLHGLRESRSISRQSIRNSRTTLGILTLHLRIIHED